MDLTIKEIKREQKKLEDNIVKLLNEFSNKTSLKVMGKVGNQYDAHAKSHYVYLGYSNPF